METKSSVEMIPEVLLLWLKKAVSTGEVTGMDPGKSIPAPHFLQVSLFLPVLGPGQKEREPTDVI